MSQSEIHRIARAREYWESRRRAKFLTIGVLVFAVLGGGTLYLLRSHSWSERLPASLSRSGIKAPSAH